ncbi:MAG: HAMP domain-containing histidine kinase [Bifidobacteriaceae bacterium]|nr:HAMP domain-containing histidine kinase [Bifidobacteriaceae bacterium]
MKARRSDDAVQGPGGVQPNGVLGADDGAGQDDAVQATQIAGDVESLGRRRASRRPGRALRKDAAPIWGWREFLTAAGAISGFWACMAGGWLLVRAVVGRAGHPPGLISHLCAIAVGLAGLAGLGWLGGALGRGRRHGDFGHQIRDALDRIAQGDFSVRLPTATAGPLREVVASVNKMAVDLGSLEQRRQEFVSNVSHEIGSPLTSIVGFARLLIDQDPDVETRRRYLDIIAQEAGRLSKLSENLLRLSALDDAALNRRQHRVDNALRDVVVALEPQWSAKGLSVEVEADVDSAPWSGDEDMMRQVWVNLVQNAVKFTPEGGRVTVRLRRRGAELVCSVEDTGVGIASEDLPHVFERFFRADKARSQGGNGLGLALAKRIVELHGGRVGVTSKLGAGAVFTVYLPLKAN